MPRISFILIALALPLVVGCEGCRRDRDSAVDKPQDKPPLEDFSAKMPTAFPGDRNAILGGIKPGHWLTASQPLKSNNQDARGELHCRITVAAENIQSGATQSVDGPIATVRPVVLPKGQLRTFDYRMLAPIPPGLDERKSFLSSRFLSSGRALLFDTGRQPFNLLAGQEFFFVILTSRPERFAKFQVAYWVAAPQDKYKFQQQPSNYRIVIPPVDDVLPLSETMLDWTATAVLFWDDLSPDALTPSQQIAVADWVHFGGQLIVNGADAADSIDNTSLASLLPLRPTGNIELNPDAAIELLLGHAVASDRSTEKQISLVKDLSARLAVDGIAASGAQAVPDSGKLILERMVGRGRVVQSRFDVTSDWISNWLSYDSFVNSALLRRPHRRFVQADAELSVRMTYPGIRAVGNDPTLNSMFRLAARDAILPRGVNPVSAPSAVDRETPPISPPSSPVGTVPVESSGSQSALASRIDGLTRISSTSGIGGWTDDSDAISICRQILRDESGIEIPDVSLVIRSLGYYLLLLVPVNYVVFRLLGRLEYAWLAVPLIAMGGAVWVARAARLDIGFARSQTQMALVELQPEYQRGHLSRVVAIYNSLSSRYDIQFDTIDGAAMPIDQMTAVADESVLKMGYDDGPSLTGLAVGSNQVRMLHAEQMIDMGGAIGLSDDGRLINQTKYDLLDAYVVEKSDSGEVQVSTLGLCQSGATVQLRRSRAPAILLPEDLPIQTGRFIGRLASAAAMPLGTSRLVARIDQSLPGMTITPQANQTVAQTILLAHLKHRPPESVEQDENLVSDFVDVLTDEISDTPMGDETSLDGVIE